MPEKTDYERFVDELKEQLQPIKDAIATIMHPETGFYPQLRDVKSMAKRVHERVDVLEKRVEAHQHTLYGNGNPGLVDIVRNLDEHRRSVVKTLLWIGSAIGTPLIGGLVYLILRLQ